MSEKAARTHNYGSNRVKHREIGEKKTVFKSVLDNPFRIQWSVIDISLNPLTNTIRNRPSVPLNVQNSVLAHVIDILNGVADYQHTRSKANRKRKRGEQGEPMKRKKPDDTNKKTLAMDLSETASSTALSLTISSDKTSLERPPTILEHLVVGINQVTKRLETQIRDKRITILTAVDGSNMGLIQPPLQVIFVCRADIDPPLLIDHLPHLVAAYNSVQTTNTLKIVSLPKGAESALAQAVGLRRAGVIGIDVRPEADYSFLVYIHPRYNGPKCKCLWTCLAQSQR